MNLPPAFYFSNFFDLPCYFPPQCKCFRKKNNGKKDNWKIFKKEMNNGGQWKAAFRVYRGKFGLIFSIILYSVSKKTEGTTQGVLSKMMFNNDFKNFTGRHLCRSLFLINFQVLGNFILKERLRHRCKERLRLLPKNPTHRDERTKYTFFYVLLHIATLPALPFFVIEG